MASLQPATNESLVVRRSTATLSSTPPPAGSRSVSLRGRLRYEFAIGQACLKSPTARGDGFAALLV